MRAVLVHQGQHRLERARAVGLVVELVLEPVPMLVKLDRDGNNAVCTRGRLVGAG